MRQASAGGLRPPGANRVPPVDQHLRQAIRRCPQIPTPAVDQARRHIGLPSHIPHHGTGSERRRHNRLLLLDAPPAAPRGTQPALRRLPSHRLLHRCRACKGSRSWRSATTRRPRTSPPRADAPADVPPLRHDAGQRLSKRHLGARRGQGGQGGRVRPDRRFRDHRADRRNRRTALGEDDEVITATLDLADYIKRTIFNLKKHRRIEHYRLITKRIGAKVEV